MINETHFGHRVISGWCICRWSHGWSLSTDDHDMEGALVVPATATDKTASVPQDRVGLPWLSVLEMEADQLYTCRLITSQSLR